MYKLRRQIQVDADNDTIERRLSPPIPGIEIVPRQNQRAAIRKHAARRFEHLDGQS